MLLLHLMMDVFSLISPETQITLPCMVVTVKVLVQDSPGSQITLRLSPTYEGNYYSFYSLKKLLIKIHYYIQVFFSAKNLYCNYRRILFYMMNYLYTIKLKIMTIFKNSSTIRHLEPKTICLYV